MLLRRGRLLLLGDQRRLAGERLQRLVPRRAAHERGREHERHPDGDEHRHEDRDELARAERLHGASVSRPVVFEPARPSDGMDAS